MTDLAYLSIAEGSALIRDKKLSPVEWTEALIARVEQYDGRLNAFLRFMPEIALSDARRAEAEISAGNWRGTLHGVPYGLKDIIDYAGLPTTAHSAILKHNIATADAFVTQRLRAAGAVFMGKLSTHEFAIGGPCFDLPWPPARNPWNRDYFCGGSSSGSGVATAAGFLPFAIGTDTGGSIRNPSTMCGVTGIKPTYGLVSRRGVFPLAFSLDHVGPLTRTVHDNAIVLNALAGHDGLDPGSIARPGVDYTALTGKGLKGVRIGWLKHFYHDDIKADPQMGAAVDAAVLKMQELGAQVTEVKTIPLSQFQACNRIIMGSESYAIHQKWLRERPQDYGDITRQRFLYGAMYSASDYINALRMRSKYTADFHALFNDVDVIVTASAHDPACRIDDPEACEFIYSRQARAPFNVTGSPAIAVPAGFSKEGLPLGIQIVGAPYNEATVYRVGAAYEAATAWTAQHPVLPA
ncbi:MAG: amidase [Burkholderiales bacterium]|nr:amidase [Burkholderiales bacterium]